MMLPVQSFVTLAARSDEKWPMMWPDTIRSICIDKFYYTHRACTRARGVRAYASMRVSWQLPESRAAAARKEE